MKFYDSEMQFNGNGMMFYDNGMQFYDSKMQFNGDGMMLGEDALQKNEITWQDTYR